jgi:hypothetical protein
MAMIQLTVLDWFTTVPKVIALVLGIYIVYLAYKGHRRNRSKPLLWVSIGFALITMGAVSEGLLYLFGFAPLIIATGTGTSVTAVGFLAIIYSIHTAK